MERDGECDTSAGVRFTDNERSLLFGECERLCGDSVCFFFSGVRADLDRLFDFRCFFFRSFDRAEDELLALLGERDRRWDFFDESPFRSGFEVLWLRYFLDRLRERLVRADDDERASRNVDDKFFALFSACNFE